ncbi:cyclic nucleotide-binding domain-containing protein [bacterium]|jgi:CRP-like cAMP-binding protein|nr:cyclic nucleotide-binding domain-containing protein [bacterium]MBQ4438595.1 cyclic nucleotide-binding domain-containing protein [bacterium]MBR6421646.1 cyclic nucleotide-binding domain-containing protein [bacterium]
MLTRVERVLALKNIELFHDIPGEVLADIAALLEEENFEKGQYIVNEGDLGKELFMIVKGEVEVVVGGNVVAVMKEGAGFGEMALIDSQPRSADIIARNDVLVLKMESDDFLEILKQRDEVALGVIRVLTGRIRELNAKLAEKSGKK